MKEVRRNDDELSKYAGTKKNTLVAVVILNWNGKHHLQQFLPSVLSASIENSEIIVADNASTDGSVDFVRTHFPGIRIVENKQNGGFAKGYNEALTAVDAKYFVLLNSDVEVDKNWLQPLVDLMESNTKIAACQPKLLDYQKKNMFEYAGAAGGYIDYLGYPLCRGRVVHICEENNGQYDNAQECFWASGAALFIQSKAYWEVGGFDEYFFAHMEEIDLCWRLKSLSYEVWVEPKSVVYHVGGGTLQKQSPLKTYLNFRNNLIMLWKNNRRSKLIWLMPVRFVLDAIAAYRELFLGKFVHFWAIAKAHYGFIFWLLFKTNKHKNAKRSSKDNGVIHRSLVWQFFIKKRQKFAEIVGNK